MRRKKRALSEDDLALWKQVTGSTSPIRKPAAKPHIAPKLPSPNDPVARSSIVERVVKSVYREHSNKPALDNPLRMDHKKHKKMQRGKLAPDARIDLHGMTAANAHSVLTSFILNAHGRGDRLILVITGKGRKADAHYADPAAQRGVLRQSVPRWLSLAPLSQIVLQVTPANQRHGGEGAYYVYLKRQR